MRVYKYKFDRKMKGRIIHLYVTRKLCCREIGNIFGISRTTIANRLKQWDIHIRNHHESQKGKILPKDHRNSISESLMGHISWWKGKKRPDLSERIGSKHPNWKGGLPKCGCGKTIKRNNRSGLCQKCYYKIFVGKKHPLWKERPRCKFCGKRLAYRSSTYCIDCAHLKENTPNWKGGISFEPYSPEFNNQLKEQIRSRDNFRCKECGYTEKQLEHKLSIHHIDFNKQNNNPNNLISLCPSCHAQTNFNREEWTNYFQNKLGCLK